MAESEFSRFRKKKETLCGKHVSSDFYVNEAAITSLCDFETLTSWVCTQHLPWKKPGGTFRKLRASPHHVSDYYSYKPANSDHICPLTVINPHKMSQIIRSWS